MAEDLSLTRRMNLWFQSLAIIVAGAWVSYEFFLKEIYKTQHVIPVIDPLLPKPTERGTENAKFLSVDLPMTLNNISERDAYIIAGIVVSFGHKARDVDQDRFFQLQADARTSNQQLMMRTLRWQDKRDILGAASVFQKFLLSREERATQNYVLFMPSGFYDILEVEAVFHVVDACPGLFPLETCYEFASHFRFVGGVCTREKTTDGQTPYVAFYYREVGSQDWQRVFEEELRQSFAYKSIKTVRMVVLPDAPILQVTRPPASGAPN